MIVHFLREVGRVLSLEERQRLGDLRGGITQSGGETGRAGYASHRRVRNGRVRDHLRLGQLLAQTNLVMSKRCGGFQLRKLVALPAIKPGWRPTVSVADWMVRWHGRLPCP